MSSAITSFDNDAPVLLSSTVLRLIVDNEEKLRRTAFIDTSCNRPYIDADDGWCRKLPIESIVKVEQSKHELITHSMAIVTHDASFTPLPLLASYSN
jgi:hypothetical protein